MFCFDVPIKFITKLARYISQLGKPIKAKSKFWKIRMNRTYRSYLCSAHTTQENFQNAALFLPLGLPSTLIRHENGAFRKHSSNRRNLKTPALRFRVVGKHFENEAFRKRWPHHNHMICLPEFSSNTNPKWPVIVAFLNFSGVVRTENIWCVFRVKPPYSSVDGALMILCFSLRGKTTTYR